MTDNRTDFTAGLRVLADLLDQHQDIPLPYSGASSQMLWILDRDSDQKGILQSFARLLDGTVKKGYREHDFDLFGSIAGLKIQVIADRDSVCERVVKGVREVTREVPDPDVLATVPTKTITETVEDVEWVCLPLMAEAQ